jgi:hypothetical protein
MSQHVAVVHGGRCWVVPSALKRDREQNILHTCLVLLLAATANMEGRELKEGIYQPPSDYSYPALVFQSLNSEEVSRQLSLPAKLKGTTYIIEIYSP